MGVMYLDVLEAQRQFCCGSCDAPLAELESLVSTRFTSASGTAFLFDQVVNVVHGHAVARQLITGQHVVRDVFCKRCNIILGWYYELAMEASQRYKEGMTVLERSLITEFEYEPEGE